MRLNNHKRISLISVIIYTLNYDRGTMKFIQHSSCMVGIEQTETEGNLYKFC